MINEARSDQQKYLINCHIHEKRYMLVVLLLSAGVVRFATVANQ